MVWNVLPSLNSQSLDNSSASFHLISSRHPDKQRAQSVSSRLDKHTRTQYLHHTNATHEVALTWDELVLAGAAAYRLESLPHVHRRRLHRAHQHRLLRDMETPAADPRRGVVCVKRWIIPLRTCVFSGTHVVDAYSRVCVCVCVCVCSRDHDVFPYFCSGSHVNLWIVEIYVNVSSCAWTRCRGPFCRSANKRPFADLSFPNKMTVFGYFLVEPSPVYAHKHSISAGCLYMYVRSCLLNTSRHVVHTYMSRYGVRSRSRLAYSAANTACHYIVSANLKLTCKLSTNRHTHTNICFDRRFSHK
jgi:hypothetical protein